MNIQLTISLLVSDRLETLGRCLHSIEPLLRELDSELILVFTGKDERVRKLAEEYTPQVIPFTWCNDFARARNVGIEHARGEWFLFLDDDEWFDDVTEILQFFRSGEYKDYGSALYVTRNYTDWEGRHYIDFDVGRMCRLTPETKFIFPIHENLTPFPEPHKKLNCFVHHFGYVNNRKQGEERPKNNRNIPLLLKRLEEEPDSPPCLAQLAMEYDSLQDYEKAIAYCRRGLAASERQNGKEIYGTEIWMQCNLPRMQKLSGDERGALETAEAFLDSPRTLELAYAWQCANLVEICFDLEEHQKGMKYIQEFHRRFLFLRNHAGKAALQGCGDVTYAAVEERSATTYFQGLACAGAAGNAFLIKRILSWMPWDEEHRIAPFYVRLEAWKMKYPEQKDVFLEGCAGLKNGNAYVNLQKAYREAGREHIPAAEGFWRLAAADCPPGLAWELVQMAVRHRFSLDAFLEKITVEDWRECVETLAEMTDIPEMEKFCRDSRPLFERYPVYGDILEQTFLERRLSRGLLDPAQLTALLGRYCQCVTDAARPLYREDVLQNGDAYALPSRLRFALKIQKALDCIAEENYRESIPPVQEALRIYPRMSAVVNNLVQYLRDQIQHPPRVVSEEFVQLGGQVKQALRGMIAQGQWEEAYGVAVRFAAILPDDREVLRLKQQILRREK